MPDQRPTAKIPPLSTWEMIDPRGAWYHPISGIRVISTLDDAEYPDDSGEIGPQWHVSVTRVGSGRVPLHPSQRDVDFALKAFDMVGAEEDNHEPGQARHFWMPVDPTRRVTCQCKATEDTIVDPTTGHVWTNPKPGEGECRGCSQERDFARAGLPPRPCPLHSMEIRR